MKGQHIIQNSVMLRGRREYTKAIKYIEEHIDEVDNQLISTAWQEARSSAEALNLTDKVKQFRRRAEASELKASITAAANEGYYRCLATWC